MNFEILLPDGEQAFISLHRLRSGDFVCFAARTRGKGKNLRNPPKGWRIRKDPQDDAFQGQPEHYHCKRDSDGVEIVITADGYGGHDTDSGTRIPKRLGDYLVDELGIPVERDADNKHVVRLVCRAPWNYYFPPFHPDLLAHLWTQQAYPAEPSEDEA